MTKTFDKQGHRGCRGLLPENTIPAMMKALELGVTTLEMDVVITGDSQVLVSHEPFFNHEITTKEDGSFVTEAEGRSLNIYKMPYGEIKKFDVGLKPHPRFSSQQKIAAVKPLLHDLILQVEQVAREKKRPLVWYNIETKTTPLTDNIFHPAPEAFVQLLLDVIVRSGVESRVIIQSFDIRTLQVLHKMKPAIKTALLVEGNRLVLVSEQIARLGFTPTIFSPAYELVTAQLVQDCHAAGLLIIPWTVNTQNEIKSLTTLGVDGIISDFPDLFITAK